MTDTQELDVRQLAPAQRHSTIFNTFFITKGIYIVCSFLKIARGKFLFAF